MNDELTKQNFFESTTQYHPLNEDLIAETRDHYELERLATQYKSEKNWNKALSCLYEVKNNLEDIDDPHYFNLALRLALYLQQAGRFDEAKFELQNLVDNLDYIVELKIAHHREKKDFHIYQKWAKNLLLHQIFDTARKIYKREKLNAEAQEFEKISLQHSEIFRSCLAHFDQQRMIRVKQRQEEGEKLNLELEEWKKEQEQMHQQEKKKHNFFWLWVSLGFIVYQLIKQFIF